MKENTLTKVNGTVKQSQTSNLYVCGEGIECTCFIVHEHGKDSFLLAEFRKGLVSISASFIWGKCLKRAFMNIYIWFLSFRDLIL